jgi:hypothetical protein
MVASLSFHEIGERFHPYCTTFWYGVEKFGEMPLQLLTGKNDCTIMQPVAETKTR